MKDNRFFNPSPLYKEFMLLDVIEKNESITQRDMSSLIHASVSMINEYLVAYENKDYIKRHYLSSKTVKYEITHSGLERKKLLNLWFLSDSHHIYLSAKENILQFLKSHTDINHAKLFLYGAGEMAEIILDVIQNSPALNIDILGCIDDDPIKQKSLFKGLDVYSYNAALQMAFDAIFISSYNHHQAIYQALIKKVPSRHILRFF